MGPDNQEAATYIATLTMHANDCHDERVKGFLSLPKPALCLTNSAWTRKWPKALSFSSTNLTKISSSLPPISPIILSWASPYALHTKRLLLLLTPQSAFLPLAPKFSTFRWIGAPHPLLYIIRKPLSTYFLLFLIIALRLWNLHFYSLVIFFAASLPKLNFCSIVGLHGFLAQVLSSILKK